MQRNDTKKPSRQSPVRELPKKSGFGSAEIRTAMLEDINRGIAPVDRDNASQFIYDGYADRRRKPDF